jgi:ATP-dependent DNA helicase RecG
LLFSGGRKNAVSQAELKSPVTVLHGVGSRVADKLRGLGIETVQDLLFHLPSRYEDRTRVAPLGSLRGGERVAVEGEVELTEVVYRRRRMMLSRLADGTGSITLRFFHFSKQQQQGLSRGTRIRCFGEVRTGFGGMEMVHPEYQRIAEGEVLPTEESLTAIYPATEGVHQLTLRKLIGQALAFIDANTVIEELIPPELYHDDSGYTLVEALRFLHRPPPDVSLDLVRGGRHPCQQRLAFEELLAHNVSLRRLRRRMRQHHAPVMDQGKGLYEKLAPQLGFELTRAQSRVISEIVNDLKNPHPMMRLVQGDVGSGKTVVATIAALQAIESGYQVAIMAPTEILAEQHFRNLDNWLTPLGIRMAWLSGKQKGKARQQAMYDIESGQARLVVGTHALFQEEVIFQELGLIIVDEQHRFGVHQRLKLMEKGMRGGLRPHQMIMTATPIPRTLAMSAYADLDTSVIDELPPGRRPVTTVVVPEERRDEIIERVEQACGQGRQVYWVCPLIEESEALQAQAATETENRLKQQLPGVSIQLIHGRLKPVEKEQIMQNFKAGRIDLLVATTVIEVGVDVPNASLMIIENAERLGLSQLHQLRGRVGRGDEQSSCVLMYRSPLGEIAKERLSIMRETTDGFEIAQRDLEIRGPGEVLGTRQTGVLELRVADLIRDQELMPRVVDASKKVFKDHPEMIDPLLHRWLRQGLQFAEV